MSEKGPRNHIHKANENTAIIQDLRMEFNNDIETLTRTQSEMKMQLKKHSNCTKKVSEEIRTKRLYQVE